METKQPASQSDKQSDTTDSTNKNLQFRLEQPVTTRTQALFLQAVAAIYNSDPQTLRPVLAQVKDMASFDRAYRWYRKDGPERQYNPCLSEAAISLGDTACLAALLDYGLPTDMSYSHYPEDQSMLMFAMACNQYECFKLIIDYGIPGDQIPYVTFDYWGAQKGQKRPSLRPRVRATGRTKTPVPCAVSKQLARISGGYLESASTGSQSRPQSQV